MMIVDKCHMTGCLVESFPGLNKESHIYQLTRSIFGIIRCLFSLHLSGTIYVAWHLAPRWFDWSVRPIQMNTCNFYFFLPFCVVNNIYIKLIIIFTHRIPISEKDIFQNVTFYDCNTLPLFSIKLFANSCI